MPQMEREPVSNPSPLLTAPSLDHSGGSQAVPPDFRSGTVDMSRWLSLLVMTTTALLLLLSVGVATWLLLAIGHTLLLFTLGGLLAYALEPLANWIVGGRTDRRVRTRSVLLVFLIVTLALILGVTLLSAEGGRQVNLLVQDHVKIEAQAHHKLADIDRWLKKRKIQVSLEEYLNHPPPRMRRWGESVAQGAVQAVGAVGQAILEGAIVLLVALYFMLCGREMREGINNALPLNLRAYVEPWEEDVNRILGRFVRGQILLALIMGGLASLSCLLLGIPLWLLIGLFTTVASLIPAFGTYLGAVPAVIVALLTPSGSLNPIVRVVILIVAFVVINEFGARILYPRMVGAALGLHELLVLFLLFAGYEAGGLIGVLFATPLTALVLVTITQLYRLWQGLPPSHPTTSPKSIEPQRVEAQN